MYKVIRAVIYIIVIMAMISGAVVWEIMKALG